MTQVLQIGPLVLSLQVLLVFVAVGLATFVGKRVGKKVGLDIEGRVWRVALVALVAARLVYVWQFRSAYFAEPLDILDIRDGGWSPQAGLVVAWLYALSLTRPDPALKKPVLMAMSVGTAVWIAGTVALALAPDNTARLPQQSLAAPDGRQFDLASFAGKPTVVNFWATWCPPCIREMPVLQQAQAERTDVHFVFLNQGESADRVNQFLARNRLNLSTVLLDTKGEVGSKFGQSALPTTLFFDARGQLVGTRVGELSRATLTQRLDAITTPTDQR